MIVTVCAPALSVMVSVAPRWLMPPGLKVTLMVQLEFDARDDPQLLVCKKSPKFVPLKAKLVMVTAADVVLLSVTASGALVVFSTCVGKTNDVGVTLTEPPPVPVPVKVTD